MFQIKPGSRIRFEGELDPNATPPYSKMILSLTICEAKGEVTDAGPAQNGDRDLACEPVPIVATDTVDDIAAKIKAEVDSKITEG